MRLGWKVEDSGLGRGWLVGSLFRDLVEVLIMRWLWIYRVCLRRVGLIVGILVVAQEVGAWQVFCGCLVGL